MCGKLAYGKLNYDKRMLGHKQKLLGHVPGVCRGLATPLMLYAISVWPRSSILTKRNPKVNSDYVFISRTCLTTHEYGIHELTYCLLKEKDSLDCVRVVYFSDSSVRNSVFRTVSITVSYSSRTCRTTKSSW